MRSSASEYVYVRVGYFNFRSGGINWIDSVLKTCTETHKKTVVNDVAEFRDRIRGKLFLADESRCGVCHVEKPDTRFLTSAYSFPILGESIALR